jgi:alpha-L-rhamnosidase
VSIHLPFRWRSQWVWLGDTGAREGFLTGSRDPDVIDRFVLLRRTFSLDAVPDDAVLRATANSRLIVWVNGQEVARGPVRSDPRGLRAEIVTVAPHLRVGRNVVAVLARYYGVGTSWWLPGPVTQGLGCAAVTAELALADGTVIGTDEHWRAHAGTAWRPGPRPSEVAGFMHEMVDARELPVGWTTPDFDDEEWAAADVLSARTTGWLGQSRPPSDPHGPLPPRPIPRLDGARREPVSAAVLPMSPGPPQDDPIGQVLADCAGARRADRTVTAAAVTVELAAAGTYLVTFDFGETVSGTLRLDVDGPAGARIDWALAEESDADGLLAAATTHAGLRYVCRGHDDTFESFDPMGGRFAVAAVRTDGPLTIGVAVQERLFPRDPDAVEFRCSDPLLERVFETGLRTVDLCSHDAYVDCPTRESRAWTGDSVVAQSVHLAVSDDWSLARWHAVLAHSPRTDGMLPMAPASNLGGDPAAATYIPDFALHWIRGVHNLMRYTGDRELVADLLAGCEGALRWFVPYQAADGLLRHVPGWVLIDWSNVSIVDTGAALNALWARGLRDFEEMARWLGDGNRAGWAAGLRQRVRAGFEVFWDAGRELYRDHRVDGVVGPATSRHANAAAICAGIVPRTRLDALAGKLADRSLLARSAPSLEAAAAGDLDTAFRYIVDGNPPPSWDLRRQILEAQPFFRYVVHDALAEAGRADLVADACRDWALFLDAGERSWPESWAGGSHCHGWSSTPTRDLIVYTLGIGPAEPGFGRVRVAPRLGDLAWAQARVPTPAGPVWVRATRDSVEVDSPVPVLLDHGGGSLALAAGRHQVPLAVPAGID